MTDFDPNVAATWDENQHAVYWVGHREGESERDHHWLFSLEDVLPDEVDGSSPGAVIAWLRRTLRHEQETA